jgi:hypothetical protein
MNSRALQLGAALTCLAVCLVVPFMVLSGALGLFTYKKILLFATVGWFIFATWWITTSKTK